MTVPSLYPIDEVLLQSRHGLITQYISNGRIIVDQEVGYLDDVMDCLDQYKGDPIGFRGYCVLMQQQELSILMAATTIADDHQMALVEITNRTIRLLIAEPADGFVNLCKAWRADRTKTAYAMKSNFAKGRKALALTRAQITIVNA